MSSDSEQGLTPLAQRLLFAADSSEAANGAGSSFPGAWRRSVGCEVTAVSQPRDRRHCRDGEVCIRCV